MGLRLFTTVGGLVRLALDVGHPSAHLQPNTLVQWLSFMPQLEKLLIVFFAPIYGHGVEGQVMHIPISSHVRLPNLRWITTPRLEELRIQFFEPLNFSIPRLLHFMKTTENLKFDSANWSFSCIWFMWGRIFARRPRCIPFQPIYSAGPFRGYLQELKHLILLVKYTLLWSISLSNTGSHLKSTIRSTAPSGANFLGRLPM